MSRHTSRESVLWQHRVRQVIGFQYLTKQLFIRGNTAHGHATIINTVVALQTSNKTGFPSFALQLPVGSRHFQRRIGRFGSRVGIKDMIQISGHEISNLGGELEGFRVSKLKRRAKIELCHLSTHRFGNLGTRMPQSARPKTRVTV